MRRTPAAATAGPARSRRYHAMSGGARSGMRSSLSARAGARWVASAGRRTSCADRPPRPRPTARRPAARRRLEACACPSRPPPRCGANCATRCVSTTAAGGCVVAVDGIDGAGKTVFADGLAEVFAEDGSAVFRASIDGFHRPRAERYARGRRLARGLLPRLVRLRDLPPRADRPVPRRGADRRRRPDSSSRRSTSPATPRSSRRGSTAPRDAVLIVDGIFLHRPELRGPVGLVGLARRAVRGRVRAHGAARRLRPRPGGAPRTPATATGQELYLARRDPRAAASAIVDNTDLAHPQRVFRDFR